MLHVPVLVQQVHKTVRVVVCHPEVAFILAGADGQQDSRSIKRHLKEELEKFEQRFDKKLKVTVTATGTAEQQGGRLLEETRPDISIIDLLGPMTHRRTTSKALHLIKEDFATLQANKSAGESKVQAFVCSIVKKLTTLLHRSARIVEDTSTSGLLHTAASTKLKPDMCM